MHNDTKRIAKLYEDLYVGKTATYKSKYGSSTPGIVVEHIHVITEFLGTGEHRANIVFISDKGNVYEVDELYFKNND